MVYTEDQRTHTHTQKQVHVALRRWPLVYACEAMVQPIDTLVKALQEIRNSERFGRILLIILRIGNVMNEACSEGI